MGIVEAIVGALIAAGAATVAAGLVDSIKTGKWGPGYAHRRDTANMFEMTVPGAQSSGLGNELREAFNLPTAKMDDWQMGVSIASDVMKIMPYVGAIAGGIQTATQAADTAIDVTEAVGDVVDLGSDLAQTTFQSSQALDAWENPLTQTVKSTGLEQLNTPAQKAGAAAGVATIAEQGGAVSKDAADLAYAGTKGSQNFLQEAIKNLDDQIPLKPLQHIGRGIETVMEGVNKAANAPFDYIRDLTNPTVGNIAQKGTYNIGAGLLSEAGQDDPDFGRAALSGLAGTAAGYTAAGLLSPSQAFVDELKARQQADPAATNGMNATIAGSTDKLLRRAPEVGAAVAEAYTADLLTPDPVEPPRYQFTNPYRSLYPERYLRRFNPKLLG